MQQRPGSPTGAGFGIAGVLLLASALAVISCWGQWVDRIAAVVDDEVVTLSDLDWLIRYQRMTVPDDPAGRHSFYEAVLQQVIDQKLIALEALRTPGIEITAQQVQARVDGFRKQFESEAAFRERLDQLQMGARDLEELFHRQLAVLAFVKLRFEPFIIVVPDQIQEYYQQELLPELESASQTPPPLELVEEQIREILTVEKTNQEMDNWVRNARRKANVHVLLFRDPPWAPNVPEDFRGSRELQPLGDRKP